MSGRGKLIGIRSGRQPHVKKTDATPSGTMDEMNHELRPDLSHEEGKMEMMSGNCRS